MHRFLFLLLLLLSTELSAPATVAAQSESATSTAVEGLPARPSPFRFVTDEAKLLSAADAKTLESGLRRYADNTGTQIVVVTVPTLGGRTVADYGRALGQAWGVGQREKNNGIVVLLSGQERKVTIQAGSGLQSAITPELTARVINDQMTPSFKQGNYFAGIRTGLNTLMLAANPESNPNKNQPATANSPATASGAAGTGAAAGSSSNLNSDGLASTDNTPATEPFTPQSTVPAPQPSGLGIGTLAIGALLIGGVIWGLLKLFRRKSQPTAVPGNAPDFYGNGNRPTGPTGNYNRGNMPPQQPGPDFYGNRGPGMGGNGYGGGMGSGMGGGIGSGMGGILATGAAAAAGAYLGNRMASGGHDESGNGLTGHDATPSSLDPGAAGLAGAAGAAGGTSSADEFPAFGGSSTNEAAPDYFSQDDSSFDNSSPDYFSSDDNSSYDDMSSDDTGGGGFDSDDDNSGSW
ncbi:TPM domain-containing protein [Hymenobacter sp. YC55]|uniref:TPM domain-containing protein n=1 Tax=Hymenobacter sp. YC55 TaxID=3034019 RepID=UPI0023F8F6EF|nr:TPM domain-containing protein [Hymenobacter sp. YC55]MDF7812593.1 TPM domain-containing protein [Hymenobacter sp. YC55]